MTLPPSFGSAYVGETFSCSLSANNELPTQGSSKIITSIRIMAEMQTPSQIAPLELTPPDDESSLGNSQSIQKIVQFDLKEEGNHVLAVSVSYTETIMAPNMESPGGVQAASGRVRTFRKLYQFIAQPCLSVRTKTTELSPQEVDDRSLGPYGKAKLLRFALEAQLENVGDGPIVLGVSTTFRVFMRSARFFFFFLFFFLTSSSRCSLQNSTQELPSDPSPSIGTSSGQTVSPTVHQYLVRVTSSKLPFSLSKSRVSRKGLKCCRRTWAGMVEPR